MKELKDTENAVKQIEAVDFSRPRSMVDQIYRDLGHSIAKGELLPGTLLKETELQEWFGVSRAPIREAIRLLEADGVVIVDAYKKKYIRHITQDYVQEVIPVVALLEGYGAALAARRLGDEEIDELKKINIAIESAYQQRRYNLCGELNFDFHRLYMKAANNKTLNNTIRSINKKVMWFFLANFVFKKREAILLTIKEHEIIIREFATHNSKRCEKAVKDHIINSLERSLKNISFDAQGHPILHENTDD